MDLTVVSVGMAEIAVSKKPVIFSALGLGSCIGLVAQCRRTKVAGMVHIMLPEAFAGRAVDKVGKFADTGVPALLAELKANGSGDDLLFAYAGGAQVFAFGAKGNMEIGSRNSAAVSQLLSRHSGRVVAKEVGGTLGRTMSFDMSTGIVTIKNAQEGIRKLCDLLPASDTFLRRSA